MLAKRLFVALDLPSSITDQLAELDPHLRGVRWLRPDQMHLTLGFFGEVDPPVEETLSKKLAAIRFTKFFLPTAGIGCFPGKGRPKVVWSGIGAGHPQLFHLHKGVQDAALAAGLEPELRGWQPHITIGRCRDVSAETVRPFLKANVAFEAGLVRVESFFLFSSRPGAGGSVYEKELEVKCA